jgi:hypothetical protein
VRCARLKELLEKEKEKEKGSEKVCIRLGAEVSYRAAIGLVEYLYRDLLALEPRVLPSLPAPTETREGRS